MVSPYLNRSQSYRISRVMKNGEQVVLSAFVFTFDNFEDAHQCSCDLDAAKTNPAIDEYVTVTA